MSGFFDNVRKSIDRGKLQYGSVKQELINFQRLSESENFEYLGRIDDKQQGFDDLLGNVTGTLCYLFRNTESNDIVSLFSPTQDVERKLSSIPHLEKMLRKREQAKQDDAEENFDFIPNPNLNEQVKIKSLYKNAQQEIIPLGLHGEFRRHWVTLQILPAEKKVNYIDPKNKNPLMQAISKPASRLDQNGNYSYLTSGIIEALQANAVNKVEFNKVHLGNQDHSDAFSCGAHGSRIALALAKKQDPLTMKRQLPKGYFQRDEQLQDSAIKNPLLDQAHIAFMREEREEVATNASARKTSSDSSDDFNFRQ